MIKSVSVRYIDSRIKISRFVWDGGSAEVGGVSEA